MRRKERALGLWLKRLAPLLLAASLGAPALCAGCAVHARVYDTYDHNYHSWAAEEPYYTQWEHDTHRNHEDFKKRSEGDKTAYWDWRHNQH